MGGSIRLPAAFCGVYGHKPSLGVVPSQGNIPPLPGSKPQMRAGLGVRGPIARHAADLRVALEVLGGPAEHEGVAISWPLPPPRATELSGYRIGFLFEDAAMRVSGEVREKLEAAGDALGHGGAQMDKGWPEGIIPEQQFDAFRCFLRQRKAARERTVAEAAANPEMMRTDDASAALAKQVARSARKSWREYFRDHDAFLLPVTSAPAFPHSYAEPPDERWIEIDSIHEPYAMLPFWVSFASLAGLPATAAPVGFTSSGLPVGIQIVGPYLEDATPIDVAERLSELIGGFEPPARFSQSAAAEPHGGEALVSGNTG